MSNCVSDSAVIGYPEFVELCQVEGDDNGNASDFGGFRVTRAGLYVMALADGCFLTREERDAITGGREEGALALAFPCSLAQLREFVVDEGLCGCIDEDLFAGSVVPLVVEVAPVASGITEQVTPPEPERIATPKERRAAHDMKTERGCRRLILENWDAIEELHGGSADARQVLLVITRKADKSEKLPVKKTVHNKLKLLRDEGLIP